MLNQTSEEENALINYMSQHEPEPESAPPARERKAGKSAPTIMVVEDYKDTSDMLRLWLERQGYEVVKAVNGLEVVEIALHERPDLILMDLDLPVLDGFAATRLLREHVEMSSVPVIALTAYDIAYTRTDAFEAGCSEYITKPLDFDKLEAVLRSLLPVE